MHDICAACGRPLDDDHVRRSQLIRASEALRVRSALLRGDAAALCIDVQRLRRPRQLSGIVAIASSDPSQKPVEPRDSSDSETAEGDALAGGRDGHRRDLPRLRAEPDVERDL
jgi:hypothetical protein